MESAPKEDEHSDEEEEDEEELDDEQQNEREEDDENTDDDEAVRRRPLHYACCRHPAERAFGSRSIELALYLWDYAKLTCQTTEPGVTPMLVETKIGKILREAAAAGMLTLCQKCVEFVSVIVTPGVKCGGG
ncbi:hypothetical protein HDU88_009019 [Geranomyces variabilis]|nr:hypothetical protein HDU88_009019 [Geranomyces variabilis]